MPDIEGPVQYFISLRRNKKIGAAYLYAGQGFLHTLLGSLVVTIPLSILASSLIIGSITASIVISCLVGVISHLILDIPGHREFKLFYPYVIRKNPFLFSLKLPFVEKFYPWKKIESRKNQVLCEFSWWVVSHLLVVLSLALYLIF